MTKQDFEDTTAWQPKPDFDLANLSQGEVVKIGVDQIVRNDQGDLYRFAGEAGEDVVLDNEDFDVFPR